MDRPNDEPDEPQLRRKSDHMPEVTKRIDLGHLLQFAGIVGFIIVYVVTNHNSADNAIAGVTRLEAQLAQTTGELKGSLKEGLDGIRQQIANLPDFAARLQQAERRMEAIDATIGRLDGRTQATERQVIETRAGLVAIERDMARAPH